MGFKILERNKQLLLDQGVTKERILKILGNNDMTIPGILKEIRKTRPTQDRPSLYNHMNDLERDMLITKVGTIRKPYHRINLWSRTNS